MNIIRHRSTRAIAIGLLAGGMLLAGCGGASSGTGDNGGGTTSGDHVVKIGAAVSATGSFSHEGKLTRDGYQYWEDAVNAAGGIDVGGTKYKVNIVFADDQSDAQTGAKLTEKLITQDKVQFILGPFSSGITTATSTMGEKYNILTMASLANGDSVYQRGYKDVFSILPPGSSIFYTFLELAKQQGAKTVAIMERDDPFGNAAADGAKAKAESLGLNVVYFQKYSPDATDLTGPLTQIKGLNPDVLIASSLLEDSILITKETRDLQFAPKMMAFGVGPETPDFVKSLGADANFIYGVPWWLPTLGYKGDIMGWSATGYASDFNKKFGYVPDYHPAAATEAGLVLQQAITDAGSLDTDKVRDAVKAFDTKTFWGPLGFDDSGQNVKGGPAVIQIQDQKIVAVYPDSAATGSDIYPSPAWSDR